MTDRDVPVTDAELLTARYGRRPTAARDRRTVLVAAVVVAVLGLAALVWVGVGVSRVPVRTQDLGFAIIDASAIDVTFLVDKAPSTVVDCRVHALNPQFAEVGVKDVRIGPDTERPVVVTTRIATSELATTGLVQRCAAVDTP